MWNSDRATAEPEFWSVSDEFRVGLKNTFIEVEDVEKANERRRTWSNRSQSASPAVSLGSCASSPMPSPPGEEKAEPVARKLQLDQVLAPPRSAAPPTVCEVPPLSDIWWPGFFPGAGLESGGGTPAMQGLTGGGSSTVQGMMGGRLGPQGCFQVHVPPASPSVMMGSVDQRPSPVQMRTPPPRGTPRGGSASRTPQHKPSRVGKTSTGTTLMLRNVPVSWNQEDLLDFVDNSFFGSYDFLFLPVDLERDGNVGYAFVNFCSPQVAEKCRAAFDQQVLQGQATPLEVTFATVQGYIQNIEHWRNSPICMAKEARWRPLVMINGQWQQLRATSCVEDRMRQQQKENRPALALEARQGQQGSKSVHRGGSARGRGRGAYFCKPDH